MADGNEMGFLSSERRLSPDTILFFLIRFLANGFINEIKSLNL